MIITNLLPNIIGNNIRDINNIQCYNIGIIEMILLFILIIMFCIFLFIFIRECVIEYFKEIIQDFKNNKRKKRD